MPCLDERRLEHFSTKWVDIWAFSEGPKMQIRSKRVNRPPNRAASEFFFAPFNFTKLEREKYKEHRRKTKFPLIFFLGRNLV